MIAICCVPFGFNKIADGRYQCAPIARRDQKDSNRRQLCLRIGIVGSDDEVWTH